MNIEEQKQFFKSYTDRMAEIMLKKGNDYSGQDRLSNFKTVGDITATSAEKACLNLIATKVARLGQLFSGKTPNNESIDDSILDLANYAILLGMIVSENAGMKVTMDFNKEEPITKKDQREFGTGIMSLL